jgi:hypothetical protein
MAPEQLVSDDVLARREFWAASAHQRVYACRWGGWAPQWCWEAGVETSGVSRGWCRRSRSYLWQRALPQERVCHLVAGRLHYTRSQLLLQLLLLPLARWSTCLLRRWRVSQQHKEASRLQALDVGSTSRRHWQPVRAEQLSACNVARISLEARLSLSIKLLRICCDRLLRRPTFGLW